MELLMDSHWDKVKVFLMELLMGAEMGASAAPSAGPGAMLRPPAAKKPRVLAPAAATPLAAVGDA